MSVNADWKIRTSNEPPSYGDSGGPSIVPTKCFRSDVNGTTETPVNFVSFDTSTSSFFSLAADI